MTDIYLGVLSGTSMDAIDVGAFTFNNDTIQFLAGHSKTLPTEYKQRFLKIIDQGECELVTLGSLDQWTGELFGQAVNEFLAQHKLAATDITAIGSHGQTIWHAPFAKPPFTLQIGDPNLIAALTGITTVADFRRADIAAGGQGAPLAPALHQAVFGSEQEPRSIVNIGGISNISILKQGSVSGFDCGPGNCLMDQWTAQEFQKPFDQDGVIARSGAVNSVLLERCLADPYFAKQPPKSSGHEYFNMRWLLGNIKTSKCESETPQNILTTLTALTAKTIADAILQFAPESQVYICGGGSKNTFLLDLLNNYLARHVKTTAELGLEPQWVEAALFAWLARQNLHNKRIDLTNITHSRRPVLLGGVYRV